MWFCICGLHSVNISLQHISPLFLSSLHASYLFKVGRAIVYLTYTKITPAKRLQKLNNRAPLTQMTGMAKRDILQASEKKLFNALISNKIRQKN